METNAPWRLGRMPAGRRSSYTISHIPPRRFGRTALWRVSRWGRERHVPLEKLAVFPRALRGSAFAVLVVSLCVLCVCCPCCFSLRPSRLCGECFSVYPAETKKFGVEMARRMGYTAPIHSSPIRAGSRRRVAREPNLKRKESAWPVVAQQIAAPAAGDEEGVPGCKARLTCPDRKPSSQGKSRDQRMPLGPHHRPKPSLPRAGQSFPPPLDKPVHKTGGQPPAQSHRQWHVPA